MEAMLILPISYLHNVAVKRLVFLNHNPTKYLSPLCIVDLRLRIVRNWLLCTSSKGFLTRLW